MKFCTKQRLHFSALLDREQLPFWRGLMVRLHLRVCPNCIRYNESLTAARDSLRDLRDADVDELD